MRRTTFNEDHEAFRLTLRDFIEKEVVPHYDEWYAAGLVPRELYTKLGELGIFGIEVPEDRFADCGGGSVCQRKARPQQAR